MNKVTQKWIGIAAAAVLIILILFSCITTIGAGHTGVVSTFGKVSSNVLQEGINIKAPWQRVIKIDNRIVKLSVETQGSTKDLQKVSCTLAVNYRVIPQKSYFIVKNVGKDYENTLVTPAINEILKAVMAKYSAEECITKRDSVSDEIINLINNKLNEKGITVDDVNIVDFDFSKELDKAIEEKQIAEQNKLKAQTNKEQAIIEAEAAAEKARIEAEGKAAATITEAEAKAKANKMLNRSLSDKVINYNKIEKWDGKLPQATGSSGTIVNLENDKK